MTVRKNARYAKQRWLVLGGVVAVATLLIAAMALAVHQLNFQLDGDTSTTDIAPIAGVTRTVDWNSFYTVTGAKEATQPSGFAPGDLTKDFRLNGTAFDTSDGSTFTTGSKDTLDISSGWACVGANNVTNKGDITNAYAAQYTVPAGSSEAGDKILYFGMEKYAPQGTNNIGIWFLQDPTVGCAEDGTGNGNAFTGSHVTGDLLIVSAFSNGGAVSTILAYSWDSTLNGGAGGLVLATPTAGVDCRATPATPFDDICGAANTGSIAIKWPHASNADGPHGAAGSANIPTATFFEGGIDISNFPEFAGKCFTKYLFDTRSAVTTTASVYDYTLGTLGSCQTGLVTTPQDSSGTSISDQTISLGAGGSVSVKDQAVITVTGGSTYGGTVTFRLCGPTPLTDASYTACASGAGSVVGAVKTVSAPPNPATVTSDLVAITATGRYCFRADYSGDPSVGVPAAGDSSTPAECFKVTAPTSISTRQFVLPQDKVRIAASAGGALAGNVTFKLYDTAANCTANGATGLLYDSGAITISGASPQVATTNNTTGRVTANSTVAWRVTYVSTNPAQVGSSSECTETTAVQFVGNDTGIAIP